MMDNWEMRKAILKAKFQQLVGNDSIKFEKSDAELIGRLQKKLGKTREAVMKIISEL